MTLAANRPVVTGAGLILLLASFAAAYASEPLYLAVPVAVVATAVLLQRPHLLFYTLILSIPWSVEHLFGNGFGTDLPDEPLMSTLR